MIEIPEDMFALLYEYLDREHSFQALDPVVLGATTKMGKQLWDWVQEIAAQQGFMPSHESIDELRDFPSL